MTCPEHGQCSMCRSVCSDPCYYPPELVIGDNCPDPEPCREAAEKMELSELCLHCGRVTPSRMVRHISGDEVLCAVCGRQLDFLHNEED